MRTARNLPMMSEAQLQTAVIQAARLLGWMVYHTYDSRRCERGFPDLVLCKIPSQQASGNVAQGLIFVELKSQRGRLRREQVVWITALRSAGQEVHVWRPRDLDEAIARLQQS